MPAAAISYEISSLFAKQTVTKLSDCPHVVWLTATSQCVQTNRVANRLRCHSIVASQWGGYPESTVHAVYYCAVYFKVLCEDETVSQIFPMVCRNTVETRLATTIKIHESFALRPYYWYSHKMIVASQNIFAVSQVKPLKNPATAHAFRAAMELTVCCYDNRSDV